MTGDLSSQILQQDVEIHWPVSLPKTAEEIMEFQKDNWHSLLHLALLDIQAAFGKLTIEYLRERWAFGEKKYAGNPLFAGDEPQQAYCEVADHFNWFTKQLLLSHFSQ